MELRSVAHIRTVMRTPNEEFEYLIQFVSAAREFAKENVARAPTLKKKKSGNFMSHGRLTYVFL